MPGEVIRRVSYEIGMCVTTDDALGQPDGEQPVMVEVGTHQESGAAWIRLSDVGGYLLTAKQADVLAEALAAIEEELADGQV